MESSNPLIIAGRFCGPEGSANGGYFAGSVAVLAGRTVTVRLLRPPPLETPLDTIELGDGTLAVMSGTDRVGESKAAALTLDPLTPPGYFEAVEASRHYAGFTHHRFPTCFVCGTRRRRGDGMRIFAGPLAERGIVAARGARHRGRSLGSRCVARPGRRQDPAGIHVCGARLPGLSSVLLP